MPAEKLMGYFIQALSICMEKPGKNEISEMYSFPLFSFLPECSEYYCNILPFFALLPCSLIKYAAALSSAAVPALNCTVSFAVKCL